MNKSNEEFDLSEIVALSSEPLECVDIVELRTMLSEVTSEECLAAIYANVFNKTGWLMHSLDDEEENTPEIRTKYKEWRAFEIELEERIFDILRIENPEFFPKGEKIRGVYFVMASFMERNGYRGKGGWWCKE